MITSSNELQLHTPKVSIGMPVYNGSAFIREALDSLLAQTFADFELIISDNASTDDTEQICKSYACMDKRIRYIRHQENHGALANFQFVRDEARGEYFMWAAADDIQKPQMIEKLISVLDVHNWICCAMCDVENIYENATETRFSASLDDVRLASVARNWKRTRKRFFRNPTSNIYFCVYGLHRTSMIKQVEMNYKDKMRYLASSEIPILAQLALMGPVCSVEECLKTYRRHKMSGYHEEQSQISQRQKLAHFVGTSLVLVDIVGGSALPLLEKIILYATIVSSGLTWLVFYGLRTSIAILRASKSFK